MKAWAEPASGILPSFAAGAVDGRGGVHGDNPGADIVGAVSDSQGGGLSDGVGLAVVLEIRGLRAVCYVDGRDDG